MTKIQLAAISIDSDDFQKLAGFYGKLLEKKVELQGELYAFIKLPESNIQLNFLKAEGYKAPAWPEEPGKQQQMEHLDFVVDDLKAAEGHAINCGASKAPQQFVPHLVVMLDPAGHPFCLIQKS